MESTANSHVRLPLTIAVGWGVGTLVPAIMYNITNLFLMRFMTDVLGIAAISAGLVFFLSKIYDAVTDPLMGTLSDRTRSRWGRHRPYLILGGVLCSLSLIALFAPPSAVTGDNAMWYMLAAMILYATGYTVFNVPYLAMPAEMTESYHERSFLMSWRVTAIQGAQLFAQVAAPLLLVAWGSNRSAYGSVGMVMAAAAMVAAVICFYSTAKAPFHEVLESKLPPLLEQAKTVFKNKPFLQLMAIKFFTLLANAFSFGSLAYFVQRVLEHSDQILALLFLTSTIAGLCAIPVWLKVGKRLGKSKTLLVACLILICTGSSWLLAGPGEPIPLIIIRAIFNGSAAAGLILMGQSMLPDTIEYDRRRTGLERAGIFAGMYTTVEKLAFAMGPAITGILLGSMGYVAGTAGAAIEQPASAITAIYICVGIAPPICLVVACGFLLVYDLDEAKLKATIRAPSEG